MKMSDRGPLTTENFQYRLDEERRNDIRRSVAQEHLADLARQNRPARPNMLLVLMKRIMHLYHQLLTRASHILQQRRVPRQIH